MLLLFTMAMSSRAEEHVSMLGWVPDPEHPCGGHFSDWPKRSEYDQSSKRIDIRSDRGDFVRKEEAHLTGHVHARYRDKTLSAGGATLKWTQEGQLKSLEFQNQVHWQDAGAIFLAQQAFYDWKSEFSSLDHVYYRMLRRDNLLNRSASEQGRNVLGYARHIERPAPHQYVLTEAGYTSCHPLHPAWLLRAKRMVLNQETGRGEAYHAALLFSGVPFFYLPYVNFPLDGRRKTGFLIPTLRKDQQHGWDVTLPIYFNLAPHYDLLWKPKWMQRRGLGHIFEGRYLSKKHQGRFEWMVLHDRSFGGFQRELSEQFPAHPYRASLFQTRSFRQALSIEDVLSPAPGWSVRARFDYLSDPYLRQHFGDLLWGGASYYLLERQVSLRYEAPALFSQLLWQGDTALHPVNMDAVAHPYQKIPEWRGEYHTDNFWGNWQARWIYSRFSRTAQVDDPLPVVPRAERLHLEPTWEHPFYYRGLRLNPSARAYLTEYDLHPAGGSSQKIRRWLPKIAWDAGWTTRQRLGRWYSILHPHAQWSWIPYRDQNAIPNFDSARATMDVSELFLGHGFSGIDRIGNQHQLLLGADASLLNSETGQYPWTLRFAQALSFEKGRVGLSERPGGVSVDRAAASSGLQWGSFVGESHWQPHPHWHALGQVSYNPQNHTTEAAALYARYQPQMGRVLNVGWHYAKKGDEDVGGGATYTKDTRHQIHGSAAFELSEHTRIFASHVQNIRPSLASDFLYGLEYDGCCTAWRVGAGRRLISYSDVSKAQYRNYLSFQLALKGLSALGDSRMGQELSEKIPGYPEQWRVS